MKNRILSIVYILSVVFAIGVSYYSQIHGFNQNTMGNVSNKYGNYFTPAGYAFSIWGIIFTMLASFGIYYIYQVFTRQERDLHYISKLVSPLILANIGIGSWVIVWLYEYLEVSIGIMVATLLALLYVVTKAQMQLREISNTKLVICWWTIGTYTGWISVALIANISAYLVSTQTTMPLMGEPYWAMLMVIIAFIINILVVQTRNIHSFGLVGVWALIGIYNKNTFADASVSQVALACAIILALFVLFKFIKYPKYKITV